jgi:hypothetical protein
MCAGSTKLCSTGVLLLLAIEKSMLQQIEASPGPAVGEGLSKAQGQVGCIDTIQAQSLSYLTLVYKELGCLRGCLVTRRQNVTQTHSSTPGYASAGWGNELENGSRQPW